MLPRAALRSLRAGPVRAGSLRASPLLARPTQSVLGPAISRLYSSKKSKIQSATQSAKSAAYASHGKGSTKTQQSTGSSDKSGKPDYSTAQEEFQTPASGELNTEPQGTSPSAIDPAKAKAAQEAEEPEIPLHDLTKGIPSTLDAELDAKSRKQKGQDEVGTAGQDGDQPTRETGERELPASAYETSADKRKNNLMFYSFAAMVFSLGVGVVYSGRNWESEEEERAHPEAPSGWGVTKFYNRMWARLGSTMDYYKEPAFPKLLPDPDPAWERPYTLVLSLEDLLVHSEWTREHGWRMAKRPGVDYFLRYLSQYYELVIFTSLPSMAGGPIVQKLDPFRIVLWPLFREATKYTNGQYVKDLSYLNRDLSKIILVDTDKGHASLQPENAIILPKWEGKPGDRGLVSLIPFLEYVAAMGLSDTRQVLASFEGKEIPAEFAKREQVARERFHKQLSEERAKRPKKGSGMGFLGSALGIKSGAGMETMDGSPSLSEGLEQGKMLHDQIRERGQRNYEAMEKEIRENGETWLKEMQAEEKKMQEEAMKGMTAGFRGWFGNEKRE